MAETPQAADGGVASGDGNGAGDGGDAMVSQYAKSSISLQQAASGAAERNIEGTACVRLVNNIESRAVQHRHESVRFWCLGGC